METRATCAVGAGGGGGGGNPRRWTGFSELVYYRVTGRLGGGGGWIGGAANPGESSRACRL